MLKNVDLGEHLVVCAQEAEDAGRPHIADRFENLARLITASTCQEMNDGEKTDIAENSDNIDAIEAKVAEKLWHWG